MDAICGVTSSGVDLTAHTTSVHAVPVRSGKSFCCEYCGNTFSRKYNLVRHVRSRCSHASTSQNSDLV